MIAGREDHLLNSDRVEGNVCLASESLIDRPNEDTITNAALDNIFFRNRSK